MISTPSRHQRTYARRAGHLDGRRFGLALIAPVVLMMLPALTLRAGNESDNPFEAYLREGAVGQFVLDGRSLTRFIAGRYGDRVPDGIRMWAVRLDGESAVVEGVADMAEYFAGLGMDVPPTIGAMAQGQVPFSISGNLSADHGRGKFTIEQVSLGGFGIPLAVIEGIAATLADADAPSSGSVLVQTFRLPEGVSRAVLADGRIIVNGKENDHAAEEAKTTKTES